MVITINHVRQAGMCTKGLRSLCEENNIDFKEFLKNGMDEQKVAELDISSALIQRVLRCAHGFNS